MRSRSAFSLVMAASAMEGAGADTGPKDTLPAAIDTKHYYVAVDGSDTQTGAQEAPFRTILRASQVATPGTIIHVAPGIYAGGFRTQASGTAASRISFVSSEKWGAKIVPPVQSVNDLAWDNRGSYVDIVGFEVDGSHIQEGKPWTHGIYYGGSHGSIRNNHVHHIAQNAPCTSAGGSAIGVDSYYRGIETEVIGNLVHDIGPAGCRFVQGIYFSTSGSVKNNVVYRVSEAAIHLWHDATHVTVANNTVSSSHSGIVIGGGDFYYATQPNDYTAVYNNIVYDNTYGISEQGATGTHNTYFNNLVHQNSKSDWRLSNGLTHSATIAAQPRFVNYDKTGAPDFHLSRNSPAIGQGAVSRAPLNDFDGKARPEAGSADIGAYQH